MGERGHWPEGARKREREMEEKTETEDTDSEQGSLERIPGSSWEGCNGFTDVTQVTWWPSSITGRVV